MRKLSKLLLTITFALSITSSAFAVVVASWGGAYTESQKLGYGDPTSKALGVPIEWVDYSGGLSEIKAQKEAGAIVWDIIDVFAFDTINGCDEGIFVEFDFDKDFEPAPDGTPASEDFFTSMPSKCAVGNILYSWNYAYHTGNVKGTPKTIKDFFNTKKFPGKRAIYKSALTNLEIALAASGVKPGKGGKKIYEQLNTEKGVNKAMAKIKKLCTDPNGGCVFWSAGAQPPELLMSGEVVMATGWNGRFFNAIVGEGAPLEDVADKVREGDFVGAGIEATSEIFVEPVSEAVIDTGSDIVAPIVETGKEAYEENIDTLTAGFQAAKDDAMIALVTIGALFFLSKR